MIRVIKSRRIIFVGHVALIGEVETRIKFWLGNVKRRYRKI
jgi:hypothetical protein